MKENFKAFRIDRNEDKKIHAGFTYLSLADLSEGELVIEVHWSGINYKDALAGTAKGQILRRYPLNGGIDLSGVVLESSDSNFKQGDEILACGGGLSETLDGGYAQYARLPANIVTHLPNGLNLKEAAAIGTAGLAAGLAIVKLERNGQTPDMGPILVSGATGGVGAIAIDILSAKGYEVVALTGKANHADFLTSLGATAVVDRHSLEMKTQAIATARWGGAIDNLGGDTLAWLTRTIKPEGNIASIGLAAGIKLETTVLPFILRGISLLGVNSVQLSAQRRQSIWEQLASDLKPRHFDKIISKEIAFDDLPKAFDALISGQQLGRTLVKIKP